MNLELEQRLGLASSFARDEHFFGLGLAAGAVLGALQSTTLNPNSAIIIKTRGTIFFSFDFISAYSNSEKGNGKK